MNDREWALFTAEVEATFRGGLEEDRELALREHFGRVDFDVARRTIARLVSEEQIFVPTPGEMVGALRRMISRRGEAAAALLGMTVEQWVGHREDDRQRRIATRRAELQRGSTDGHADESRA